jgi:hypothetical protein
MKTQKPTENQIRNFASQKWYQREVIPQTGSYIISSNWVEVLRVFSTGVSQWTAIEEFSFYMDY